MLVSGRRYRCQGRWGSLSREGDESRFTNKKDAWDGGALGVVLFDKGKLDVGVVGAGRVSGAITRRCLRWHCPISTGEKRRVISAYFRSVNFAGVFDSSRDTRQWGMSTPITEKARFGDKITKSKTSCDRGRL
jgi:hypothetical protein